MNWSHFYEAWLQFSRIKYSQKVLNIRNISVELWPKFNSDLREIFNSKKLNVREFLRLHILEKFAWYCLLMKWLYSIKFLRSDISWYFLGATRKMDGSQVELCFGIDDKSCQLNLPPQINWKSKCLWPRF